MPGNPVQNIKARLFIYLNNNSKFNKYEMIEILFKFWNYQLPDSKLSKVKNPTTNPKSYPTLMLNYIMLIYLPRTSLGVVSDK